MEQRQSTGKFKQVKSLPANSTSVTLTKLKPGPNAFRVRAKFKKDTSAYSAAGDGHGALRRRPAGA